MSNYSKIVKFNGIIDHVSITDQSSTSTDGLIIYVESRHMFAYQVMENFNFKYYSNWTNSALYFNDSHTAPKTDVMYVNTTTNTLYKYDTDTSNLKVIKIEAESVDIESLQSSIASLKSDVNMLQSEGVVVHENIIYNATSNSVGTTYVHSNVMPVAAPNTKYVMTSNITSQEGQTEAVIKLQPGSKLVPNGGIPVVPVEGGEMSWVHSSDIGLIQWDESMHTPDYDDSNDPNINTIRNNNKELIRIGKKNAEILRYFVKSRYNLILDGSYYFDLPYNKSTGYSAIAIGLDRELHIKGGEIITCNYLFRIVKGGSLYAEDTTFRKVRFPNVAAYSPGYRIPGYSPIIVQTDKSLIKALEFVRCNFMSDVYENYASFTSMGNRSFISASTGDPCPSDMVPNYLWTESDLIAVNFNGYQFNDIEVLDDNSEEGEEQSESTVGKNGITTNVTGNYIFVFKIKTTGSSTNNIELVDSDQDYYKNVKVNGSVIEQSKWTDKESNGDYKYLKERHPFRGDMYIEEENGEYYFVKDGTYTNNTTEIYSMDIHSATPDSQAYLGYYKLISECTEDEANPDNRVGTTYNKKINQDILENNNIAEHNGIGSFRMIQCIGNRVGISLGNMEFANKFEVRDCTFNNCIATTFNLGTDNGRTYASAWTDRSCPIEFYNTTFNGPKDHPILKSSDTYTCGILCESDTIIVNGCKFNDLISNRYATYECYLSTREVWFENNIIQNIFSLPYKSGSSIKYPLFEWMKGKGGHNVGLKRPIRIYRNNTYENKYELCWDKCKNYMVSVFGDSAETVWETYVKRCKLMGITTSNKFEKVIIENNKFKAVDGLVYQAQTSENAINTNELIIKNNEYIFKKWYPQGMSEAGLNRPLLYVEDSYGQTNNINIEITGNTFKNMGNPEFIPLLVVQDTHPNYSIKIYNNNFYNCNFRYANKSSFNFWNPIQAKYISIKDNNLYNSVAIPDEYSHKSIIKTSVLGRGTLAKRGDAIMAIAGSGEGKYSYVEYYDAQDKNVPARMQKIIYAPIYNGKVQVKTKYMCRPLYTITDYTEGSNDYRGFPVIYNPSTSNTTASLDPNDETYDAAALYTRSLVLYFNGYYPKQWAINITYTYKGVTKTKHMEIIVNGPGIYRHSVFRDINGIVYRDYGYLGNAAGVEALRSRYEDAGGYMGFAVDSSGTPTSERYMKNVSNIDEIGLKFFVETTNGSNNPGTCGWNIHFYTDLDGTKNDPDTEIIITAYVTNICGKFGNNESDDYTGFTPMHCFVENNSEVTQRWLDIMSKPLSYVGNSRNRTMPIYMTSSDIGMRVHVGDSYYTWDGSQWVIETTTYEGPTIRVVTQQEYDILYNGGTVNGEVFNNEIIYLIEK